MSANRSPLPPRLGDGSPPGCGPAIESDKRIRREIANSNERRRMQSINAGFTSLKQLLPNKDGEKLSKVGFDICSKGVLE